MIKVTIEIDTATGEVISGRQKAATPTTIGVVSSIKFTGQTLQQNLESAVSNATFAPAKDQQGYKEGDLTKLNKAVKDFNDRDLIVTVGGFVAYTAAVNNATTNFMSLTGGIPTSPPSNYKGGVSLESINTDPMIFNFLTTQNPIQLPPHNFLPTEIGLFYNRNAQMDWSTNPTEVNAWNSLVGGATNQAFSGGRDGHGNNDKSQYAHDLAAITAANPNIKALAISADPYFQDTMEDLIQACNTWIAAGALRYVCYPLQDYNNSHTKPTKGNSALYGPDLDAAYQQLGQRVNLYLTQGITGPVPAAIFLTRVV
jgi:hypothetical protein